MSPVDVHCDCISCGYDLVGLATDAPCPECGTPATLSIAAALDPRFAIDTNDLAHLRAGAAGLTVAGWLFLGAPFFMAGMLLFGIVTMPLGMLAIGLALVYAAVTLGFSLISSVLLTAFRHGRRSAIDTAIVYAPTAITIALGVVVVTAAIGALALVELVVALAALMATSHLWQLRVVARSIGWHDIARNAGITALAAVGLGFVASLPLVLARFNANAIILDVCAFWVLMAVVYFAVIAGATILYDQLRRRLNGPPSP